MTLEPTSLLDAALSGYTLDELYAIIGNDRNTTALRMKVAKLIYCYGYMDGHDRVYHRPNGRPCNVVTINQEAREVGR